MDAIEAVADAWASIDGKLDKFRAGKPPSDDPDGHYDGYMEDAKAMVDRLASRGFTVVPLPGTGDAP